MGKCLSIAETAEIYFFRLNMFKPLVYHNFKVTGFSKTVVFHVCAYNMDQVCWSINSNIPGHLLFSQNWRGGDWGRGGEWVNVAKVFSNWVLCERMI